ncbi:MAG TPA: TolC family protein [Bacteroidales bacterium]|nr:TolC family protein [Bacteroidales bacterium]HPT10654.1 TolC family protein [Bacteroidales bacterium]
MKKQLFLALLVFQCGFVSQADNPVVVKKVTFDQALSITWQNSHVLKQADFQRLQKDQERRAAKGLYYPSVGIMANAMVMSDAIRLDLTPVKDAITPLYKTLGSYGKFGGIPGVPDDMATQIIRQKLLAGLTEIEAGNWNQTIQDKTFGFVAATVQWPVYAGGKIRAANKATAIQQQESLAVTDQKQGELMSELVERYFGLCLARQVVGVRQEVFDGLQQHLDEANKLEKEGMISKADLLHAKVYHAQANRELTKAVQETDIVNRALAGTMALSDTIEIETLSSLFYLDSIESKEYFIACSRSKNPLLKQVVSKKLLAEQAYKMERAGFLPTVAFQGTYDLVNYQLSSYVPTWEMGIGLKWTIFDGVSRFAKVKAATLRTREVEEAGLKASSDIATMINKLYNELLMYRDQLQELTTARQFAEEYLRAREMEFHQEMTNSTQVIDARLALAKIKTERLQAMYSYDVTLAKLLEFSGISADFSAYSKREETKTESY